MPLDVVAAAYAHQPLDERTVKALYGEVSLADLAEDADEIGYPVLP